MKRDAPFERRTIVILVVVVSVSFLTALGWSLFGPEIRPGRSNGADSFSRSALGHRAFVTLLRELGIPTTVSRHGSGNKAGDSASLIVAEPLVDNEERKRMLRKMVDRALRALVVLPKWRGSADLDKDGWIISAELIDAEDVETVLKTLKIDAEVVRRDSISGMNGPFQASLGAPAQFLKGPGIRPVVLTDHGSLLCWAETRRGDVLLLSDPDMLSNHGLALPGNPTAALTMLSLLDSESGPVVIDETLHGFGREPSLFRSLFDFPLLLATLQVALTVAVLLWAGMARFGPPRPPAPPLGAGKQVLINNTATLLAFGGYAGHALGRYLDQMVTDARRRLHVPAALTADEAVVWLDRIAGTRSVGFRLAKLRQIASPAARQRIPVRHARQIAQGVHQWHKEMTSGRVRRS